MGHRPHAPNHKLNMKKLYKRPLTEETSVVLQRQFALETSEEESDPNKPYDVKALEEEEEEEAMIQLLKDLEDGKTSGLW